MDTCVIFGQETDHLKHRLS